MLEIRNLTIIKKKDERVLLRNFSFNVKNKDKVAIIGEEGNGKTTLLKTLYDKSLVSDSFSISGSITKKGSIGYLEQSLNVSWNKYTISEYFLKKEHNTEIDYNKYNDLSLFYSNLSKLGFNSSLIDDDLTIEKLSGGELVKLQLAKLLSSSLDLLLLDEPTNSLDLETLNWLENFILSLNIPVIFVSHDETLLENTANVIIHLEQIKKKREAKHTIERIGYKEYIEKRYNLLKKQEQIAKKQRADYNEKMKKFRQIYSKVEHQQEIITRADPAGARLLKKKIKSLKSQEKRFEKEKEGFFEIPNVEENINFYLNEEIYVPNNKKILSLSLEKLKIENKILAKNIKLEIYGPEHIVIIGNNGCGKTTLLKHIYDILKERKDIKVGYMPQNYEILLDNELNVVDFLTKSKDKDEITKIRTFLGSMNFTNEETLGKIKELSGGSKAKLLLLKLMVNESNVLILDEPTRNLSPLTNPIIRDVLTSYNGTIISISHDRKFIKEVCNKIYHLNTDGLTTIQ